MQCSKCGAELPQNALYCFLCGKPTTYTREKRKRGNGQGSVYKRGNTWVAQVTMYTFLDENGHLHQKLKRKSGFRTKKSALEYISTLRDSEERKIPTLMDLYAVWEENDLPKLSKDKRSAYKKARERLEPIIGRKIDSLTTADLQAVVNDNASSFYTSRDMKTLLSHLYKRAVADRFVPVNLAQFISLPTLVEKEMETFTEEEIKTMWKAYADGDTFVGYMLLMCYSGARPAELFSILKSKIDFEKHEIQGAGRKTKTSKETPIAFAECVSPVLQELCTIYNGDKLYPRDKKYFYKCFHETTKRIGIRDLPPYACRHTFATSAANMNLSASVIQKIMRHAKISTSQRYIHLADDVTHNAIDSINPITHG